MALFSLPLQVMLWRVIAELQHVVLLQSRKAHSRLARQLVTHPLHL